MKETHQGFLSRSIKKQIFALQKSQAERAGAFGGGNRNPPFLKWRSLVTFFRQEKKVTRRRHPAPGARNFPSSLLKEKRPSETNKETSPRRGDKKRPPEGGLFNLSGEMLTGWRSRKQANRFLSKARRPGGGRWGFELFGGDIS